MELEILIFATLIAILLPILAINYLSIPLKAIFDSACNNQAATSFWLKCIQILVYCFTLNGTFRAHQKRQSKARCAGNGYSLAKQRNAAMAFLGGLPSGKPLSGHPLRCTFLK